MQVSLPSTASVYSSVSDTQDGSGLGKAHLLQFYNMPVFQMPTLDYRMAGVIVRFLLIVSVHPYVSETNTTSQDGRGAVKASTHLLHLYISWIRKRGQFGFQPGVFRVTQLMNCENILFINLDRAFKKQFCNSFQN